MSKYNIKEIFFVSLFFLLILVMSGFLWNEIKENSDDVLDKLEKGKSVKIISAPSSVLPKAFIPSKDEKSLIEKEVEKIPEVDAVDETELNAENMEKNNVPVSKEAVDNWSEYRDKEGRFRFRYPVSVSVQVSGETIKISTLNEAWKIKKYSNQNGSDLDVWYQNYFSEKERKNCVLSSGDLKVGKYETRHAKADSSENKCDKAGYFFSDESKKVVVRIESELDVTEQMKEILKTFEFDKD